MRETTMTSRRNLLKAATLLPVLGVGTVACSALTRRSAIHYTPSGLPLRRVQVAEELVIRRIAGLRPFRPGGFVVRADSFDDKLVIHNYGHGGGGITLSPGTSWLASEMAMQTAHKRCAVIGAGAVGLATARLMQDRGWDVHIYTRDLPPNTTSNVAGGQWSPTSVFDEEYLTPEFEVQFDAAQRFAYRYYQDLVGPRYGVSWVSNYQVHNIAPEPDTVRGSYADLYPQTQLLGPGEHPFPAPYVRHFYTMFVEPAIYLPQMLEDYYVAGGRIQITEFANREQVLALDEPVIFNCSGLGSHTLFNDTDLIPIKGQLIFLIPQPEINYLIIGNDGLYMFPRTDGLLLGGTFERNEWSTEPDPVADERIISGHQEFFNAMADPWAR
ncbi:MAG: FAD-dependent oxidoreductase [Pseudohongiellaceae bacterium]